MRALVFIIAFVPAFAFAQQAPPPKAIEITAAEYAELEKWLADQPFKFAAPLVTFLAKKQQAAQEAAKQEPAK